MNATTTEGATTLDAPKNPVRRSFALRLYPGWMIRQYADGMVDAKQVGGLGLSPGYDSIADAIAWVKTQQVGV